jgi:hypothetical protein
MDWVRMRHDGVAGEIKVPASAVAIHLNSGWVTVEDAPAVPVTPPAAGGQGHAGDDAGETSRLRAADDDKK